MLAKHITQADVSVHPDEVTAVDSLRHKETFLRRFLPSQLIRRLDAGFGRSYTVHPDTGHALYSICRALRPNHVFETGTYWGYSTAYLAAAVQKNGYGKVHTFDIYPHAGKHIPKNLLPYVALYRGRPATELMPGVLQGASPSLFFQDSRHDYEGVAEEIKIVSPRLEIGGVILFHDFVSAEVRRAARELDGYSLYLLDIQDPQQLGVAVKSQH